MTTQPGALLTCVGPDAGADALIAYSAQLAARLDIPWHAVYVETPRLQRLPEAVRRRILATLQRAREDGAQTATLVGNNVVDALADYAKTHAVSMAVLGRKPAPVWLWRQLLRHSAADQLSTRLDGIHIIQASIAGTASASSMANEVNSRRPASPWPYLLAFAACALTTLFASLLLPYFELANIVMLFLLAVVLTATRLGRGPAIAAAFVSVAAFDFFFVPPRLSFAVHDAQYLLTFVVMLVVALITGQLTASLRFQVRAATRRETRIRNLYEMARALSGALVREQITDICERFVAQSIQGMAFIVLPDDNHALNFAAAPPVLDRNIARWVFDHAQPAGMGTRQHSDSALLYLPLQAPMCIRGVLAIQPSVARWLLVPEQRNHMEIFASLLAVVLERIHYIEIAHQATLRIESERLRNSVLAALSHDLRTPLTSLVGLAESLLLGQPSLTPAQAELASGLRDEAQRLTQLVHNLLDMARLESGEVRLRMEWQPLEEIIGSSLKIMTGALAKHKIRTILPAALPLVRFDAVLLERVMCNLLENAAKYTPPDSTVSIEVRVDSTKEICIAIADNGPGFSPGLSDTLFDKFTRGETETGASGVGLGLAICRAVVEAHAGRIWAEQNVAGGARFVFTLPLGQPPQLPFEDVEKRTS